MYANNGLGLEDGNVFLDSIKMSLRASPVATMGHGSEKSRKNIIIVSHDRSGSMLIGVISLTTIPLCFISRTAKNSPTCSKAKTDQNMSYRTIVEQLLTGIFDCKFVQPQIVADIERYYRKPTHTRVSQAIASRPLCP